MDNFFFKVGEKEFGSVSLPKLKTLIREGSFSKNDYLWSAELDEWVMAEYVVELKETFRKRRKTDAPKTNIFAIASGKGGVGKTVLSCSIGVGLASMGQEIILVDGDLGGANLHTCIGIVKPELTFLDFYTLQKKSLREILIPTQIDNLSMICGSSGTLGLANPKYFQKQRFIRELKNLQADSIILDLGAGANLNTLDLFLLADEKILVITPEPTSIYEAFGFIKVCLMRELNRNLKQHPTALAIICEEGNPKPNKIQFTIADLLSKVTKVDFTASQLFKKNN